MRAHYIGIAECDQVQGTAVVIDVLRAFSTAAWAFRLGVERIVLTADLDEALRIKASIPGALAMKDSRPLAGFELSNSPVELQSVAGLAGTAIVQRTIHGTVGAWAARAATHLYCASFLVAEATARAIRASDAPEVYFVITGEEGKAEEDRACADYIAALVEDPGADAETYLHRARASDTAVLLARRVAEGVPGVHARDIETCLQVNVYDFVMRALVEPPGNAGLLTLRAYNHGNA
jgi:2-phosphosulfolactate phosphatase